ncbi:MAG: LysE family translocator, partial [Proteobacteria bacterium]|nr:LysE family translocator [Pseudomonadota bacterium]
AYPMADSVFFNALAVALVFGIVNLPCVSAWVLFGVGLRRMLSDPYKVKVFNWVMAGLLVASLWPVFAEVVR